MITDLVAQMNIVDISLLKMHPKNVEIYGDEDVSALAQSIAESGWIRPLTVTPDFVIVSGHRRYQAAKRLGYTELPIEIETFATYEAELERLLRENENRGKTPEQQIREGMTWEPIEEVKANARRLEKLKQSLHDTDMENFPYREEAGLVRDIIARRVGLGSGKTYEKGKEVVEYIDRKIAIGDILQHGELLRMTLNEQSISAASNMLDKIRKTEEKARQEQERKEAEQQRQQELRHQRYLEAMRKAEHCTLYHCSVADLTQHVPPDSIDCIITDPPYPQEFLSVYTDLARFAAYALKPGGSLIAMVGQSYLPEIIEMLQEHLTYHWTACYYTPGPATNMYHRRLTTSWKPLLWFTKGEYGGWVNVDVFKGEDIFISEKRDKEYHEWGQSESGMRAIVERLTKPNQLICDPFVGGGTTAIVAMELERRFVGCDIDETCVVSLEEIKASMVREVMHG